VRRWIVQHRERAVLPMPTMLPVMLSAPTHCHLRLKRRKGQPLRFEIELTSARILLSGAIDGAALRKVHAEL
jgi:hypothetical protein